MSPASFRVEWCTAWITPGTRPGGGPRPGGGYLRPGPRREREPGQRRGLVQRAQRVEEAEPGAGRVTGPRMVAGGHRDRPRDQPGGQVRIHRLDQRHRGGQPGGCGELVVHLVGHTARPGHDEHVARCRDQDRIVGRGGKTPGRDRPPGQDRRPGPQHARQAGRVLGRVTRLPVRELIADHDRVPGFRELHRAVQRSSSSLPIRSTKMTRAPCRAAYLIASESSASHSSSAAAPGTRRLRIRACGARPMVPDGFWALGPLPAMADATTVPGAASHGSRSRTWGRWSPALRTPQRPGRHPDPRSPRSRPGPW